MVTNAWSGRTRRNDICRWIAVCAVVIGTAAALVSQTAERPSRITQPLTSGGIVTLPGSVHPLTRRATDLGEVNSAMPMNEMTMNVSLSAAQKTERDALLAAQQDPNSPQYHQWLTQEEYGARFGLTDADLSQLTGWLESQGFTMNGVSKSRNAIYFSGQAWQVESAFHTQLHKFQLNGETHFANATELQVPAGLAGVMLNLRGLNNFRPRPHLHKLSAPAYTADTSDGLFNYLAPQDWATIYGVSGVNGVYTAGYTGTGYYLGVVGQTYAPESDITNFRNAAGLGAVNLIYDCIDSKVANCTGSYAIAPDSAGDLGEADLDIEWSGGIAKNATVVFVYAPYSDACSDASCSTGVIDPVTGNSYGAFDALQRAVQDYTIPASAPAPMGGKVLPVIGMSYGDCEASFSGDSSYQTWVQDIGVQANSQGQTIVVSSGDSGAAECDTQGEPTSDYPAYLGEYVDVPADSPNYTGVGGTTLSGDESDPTAYWNQSAPDLNIPGNAIQYIPEVVWNDTSSTDGLLASGGGVSQYFGLPTWQAGLISGQTFRMVPDIAFAASPNNDGYLVCSQSDTTTTYGTDCANDSFWSSNGYIGENVYGGTSASTQAFGGLLTLMVQKQGTGYGFGNINPTLYNLAANATSYAAVFHDITTGNNIVPCVPSQQNAPDPGCVTSGTTGTMGYTAQTGYDLATGLGSINGGALYTALFPSAGLAATTTTVTQPNPVALNGTTTLTATVTSTTPGTIAGTVTFTVGGTQLGSPVTISGGTATLPNVAVTAANGFAVGANTIGAAYSGSASYAASSGSAQLTVTSALAAATTTTMTQPNPVALNGSTSLTATVTSTTPGTITGTVTFTLGSRNLGSGTVSGGTATLPNVAVTAANGFVVGPNTIVASYGGSTSYVASSGSAQLTVTSTSVAATTTALVQPNPVALNGTTSLTATVTSTTPGTITGTVTFTLGSRNLGSGSVSGGSATLPNVAVTTANGFALGPNTIVATYGGNTSYAGSNGTGQLIVPGYTLAASVTSVSLTPSGVYNVSLTLISSDYAGTVTLTPTVTSTNGTASNVTATLTNSQYTLASGQQITPMLTLTASASAANHRPMLPWQSGGVVAFGVLLLGAPFTLRNRRALAVLLIAAAIVLLGFSMACSSGGSTVTPARVYTVTVTPSGSGVVTNPAPVTITVRVN